MTQEAFKTWWYNEGSQAPYTHHDCEEHTMRMCEVAWNEAVAAEREACAKVCDDMEEKAEGTECCKWPTPADCAYAIRARGRS